MSTHHGVLARLGARPDVRQQVGEQMVSIVRRLFGARVHDSRSYEISSCHIAKALRSVSPPARAGSLNQGPTKHDNHHEASAPQYGSACGSAGVSTPTGYPEVSREQRLLDPRMFVGLVDRSTNT